LELGYRRPQISLHMRIRKSLEFLVESFIVIGSLHVTGNTDRGAFNAPVLLKTNDHFASLAVTLLLVNLHINFNWGFGVLGSNT